LEEKNCQIQKNISNKSTKIFNFDSACWEQEIFSWTNKKCVKQNFVQNVATFNFLLTTWITLIRDNNLSESTCFSVCSAVARKYSFVTLTQSCTYINILMRSNKMQQYAGIYLLQNDSTCFGCPLHPSSGT